MTFSLASSGPLPAGAWAWTPARGNDGGGLANQPVAGAGYGEDECRMAGITLDLLPQPAHVDVDGALALNRGAVTPDRIQDLSATERLARMLRQIH